MQLLTEGVLVYNFDFTRVIGLIRDRGKNQLKYYVIKILH